MKKNKNTIYGIVIILVFVAGLVLMAGPGGKEAANISGSLANNEDLSVSLSEEFFDFGAISMAKGDVTHEFKLTNIGEEPFTIKKMYTSCMCTTASLITESSSGGSGREFGPFGMQGHGFLPRIDVALGAGEEATVRVVFDPAAHGPAGVGRIERLVYLENNAGAPLMIKVAATVTP